MKTYENIVFISAIYKICNNVVLVLQNTELIRVFRYASQYKLILSIFLPVMGTHCNIEEIYITDYISHLYTKAINFYI